MVAKEDDGNGASAIVATTVAQGQIPRGSDDSSHPVVLVRQMETRRGREKTQLYRNYPKA